MMHSDIYIPTPQGGRLANFPALAKLNVLETDLAELTRQGFVSGERRRHRMYFKLRFRRAGQQIVRYVGDAVQAAVVANELKTLQAARLAHHELSKFDRDARQILRKQVAVLEPLMLGHGFRFHGRAIRKFRLPGKPNYITVPEFNDREVSDECKTRE